MTKRPASWWWMVVLLPWVVPSLVVGLQRRPDGIDLRGPWAWTSQGGQAQGTIVLPGFFLRAGIREADFTLRRTVEVSANLSEPWLLVLGDLRSSVIRLSVNGRQVGDLGLWARRQKAEFNGLDAVEIPPGLLTSGANALELHVVSPVPAYGAIADRRLVLGPASVLGDWYLRTSKFESFLRSAPLLVFALLALLLLMLASLHGPEVQRRLALRALSLVGGSTVYLLLQTGLGMTGIVETSLRVDALFLGVVWSITGIFEFCLDYFSAWSPRGVWANRLVGGALLIASPLGFGLAYPIYSLWSFCLLLWMLAIILRSLRTDARLLTRLLTSTVLTILGTGVVDLVTDLGLWHLPRLFALSLSNASVLIASVVIGTFLALGERNRALSESLARSNEELAQALVEAQEATRVKSEFLASVSHELRTPLNSIINIPEGLLEDFAPAPGGGATVYSGEAARTARYLESLHTSGVHLLGVVNQVLDFSKLEAGRQVLSKDEVAVGAVLEDVVRALAPQAQKGRVSLNCTGDTSGTVRADGAKLAQVLLNLGSNAVKFSPEGGRVTLRAERTAEALVFHVSDEGIGIAPEHQAFIFEGFRQVEGGATRRFGGTGLGLAISRKLMELHGGALTLVSAPGRGSTFSASFPLVAPTLAPQGSARPTVVVIDDEPLVQETLRLSLRALELELVTVSDPRQGLAAIRRANPVLVILDVMMPRLSGVALLRELRADPSVGRVPVLVLSAWSSNREVVEGLGAQWMSKPWRREELVDVVKAVAGPRA